MIGRHDIVFPSEATDKMMGDVVALLRRCWCEAVVENAGELFCGEQLPIELLIYKNAAAQNSWKAKGAVSENKNLMVQLLRGDRSITVVVDDPSTPEMSCVVNLIRNCIDANAA